MNIVIFGGSFNPPHRGHLNAARAAARQLRPDKFLIIPDYIPPHKEMEPGSPSAEQRLELCRICFQSVPGAAVSDMEIQRGGKSYTADTLRALKKSFPGASFTLMVGTDMLHTLPGWHDAAYVLKNAVIAAFPRKDRQKAEMEQDAQALRERYGTEVKLLDLKPFSASSTQVRRALRFRGGTGSLTGPVYQTIVRTRLYGVRVNFSWLRRKAYAMLRPKRVAHVQGCEEEAARLAEHWGADPEKAAEAAILHDCTKKEDLPEQLLLCEKYGIIPDEIERASGKLLHAKTGAAVAEQEFGLSRDVTEAIRWHTTGRADMRLLEKVLYMADYIEPTRDFEGVERLRSLAYTNLDRALLLGFEMSLEDIRSRGEIPHPDTLRAADWYRERVSD